MNQHDLMAELSKQISEVKEQIVVVDGKVDRVDEKVNDHLQYHWNLKEQRAKEKQDNEDFKESVLYNQEKTMEQLKKLQPVIEAWETLQNNKKGLGFMAGVVGSITIIGAGIIWLATYLIKFIR